MAIKVFRGKEIGWGQLKFGIMAGPGTGFTGIKYDREDDEEITYGEGNEPQGIGLGNRKYTGSVKMRRWQANAFLKGTPPGTALPDLDIFTITVLAVVAGETYVDVVTCKFKKMSRDLKQGDKMEELDVPLTVVGIQFGIGNV